VANMQASQYCRVQPVREGQELGGKLLGGLEIGLMPGIDLVERRIWNPVTEIASAGDDQIVGASDNESRALDPAGFCVDVDLKRIWALASSTEA
jgi:hypothetical protein